MENKSSRMTRRSLKKERKGKQSKAKGGGKIKQTNKQCFGFQG
jgi:hypothetical protein